MSFCVNWLILQLRSDPRLRNLGVVDDDIKTLLDLQDKDSRVLKMEGQLAHIPRERKGIEEKIVAEQDVQAAAQNDLRALELKRKDLEGRIADAEAKMVQYKTQQMAVKKNDEYQALTHQIETQQGVISGLEDEEIGVLLEIDEATLALEKVCAKVAARIAECEGELKLLQQQEDDIQTSIDSARQERDDARAVVPERFLKAYDRVRSRVKMGPAVVPVIDHKCGGCYLRLDNESMSMAASPAEDAFCPSCGRYLFVN